MPEKPTMNPAPMGEYLLLVLLSILWGGSFTLIKVAVADFPPATLAAVRILLGGALLGVVALARGLAFPTRAGRWGALWVQGLLQGALPFTLIGWGELHIASGLAGVLNATVPLFAFLLAVFVVGSAPFVFTKFLGVLLGLAGVAGIVGHGSSIAALGQSDFLASMAVLGASASYACGAVFGHRFGDQPAVVTAAGSLLCGGATMLPFSLALDRPWTLAPSLEATLALLALALLSTALASVVFFRLIRTLGPVTTTSNAYLRALVSVAFGVVFLAEPLSWSLLAASALIVAGVVLVTRPGRPGRELRRAG
ncbi:EamA family transporter [Variovorax sp. NFACC27]|uniref:DMT family transporter n=1 Tax=unclassified Variovorax TaxID=663243 RepID=UPI00089A345D|nr:EamA-like transporter family protein [Variovorax sp. NFACC28]SEG87581.1 EamA-like transporter family protein [Variovorax sp. NFACC29]SFD28275.1 EamA-like transporter family protein [Variovorax sp. NFACC26]SFG33910.1 EamA-like transporter family protein [Variovorax sp. NFACC27]